MPRRCVQYAWCPSALSTWSRLTGQLSKSRIGPFPASEIVSAMDLLGGHDMARDQLVVRSRPWHVVWMAIVPNTPILFGTLWAGWASCARVQPPGANQRHDPCREGHERRIVQLSDGCPCRGAPNNVKYPGSMVSRRISKLQGGAYHWLPSWYWAETLPECRAH